MKTQHPYKKAILFAPFLDMHKG